MADFPLSPERIAAMVSTRRWHTRPVTREQSVAEHCHQVALLSLYLAPDALSVSDLLALVRLALVHDAHESEWGDIPFPAKQAMVDAGMDDVDAFGRQQFWAGRDPYDQVPPHVRKILDVADRLQDALYTLRYLPEIHVDVASLALDLAERDLSHAGFVKALHLFGRE
jgi:5'-deoxynucleotidase YfbR-like HD superfamily hydrolase